MGSMQTPKALKAQGRKASLIAFGLRRARDTFDNPDVLKAIDWAIERLEAV